MMNKSPRAPQNWRSERKGNLWDLAKHLRSARTHGPLHQRAEQIVDSVSCCKMSNKIWLENSTHTSSFWDQKERKKKKKKLLPATTSPVDFALFEETCPTGKGPLEELGMCSLLLRGRAQWSRAPGAHKRPLWAAMAGRIKEIKEGSERQREHKKTRRRTRRKKQSPLSWFGPLFFFF